MYGSVGPRRHGLLQMEIIHEFAKLRKQELVMDAEELENMIDALDSQLERAEPFKTKWREIWGTIRKIGGGFKEVRFAKKEDREVMWARFQSLVDRVKEIQAQERESWEERSRTSRKHRESILSMAEEATPAGPLSDFIYTVVTLPALPIKVALESILPGGEIDEKHQELKACSRRLREGWNLFNDCKDEMLGKDKHDAVHALRKAGEALQEAWENWKESKRAAKEARQEYYQRKRDTFRERVKENIAKNRGKLEKASEALARREAHLEELKHKRDSARTDEFRERVEGWIEEEERIESIKESITRIESWIEEDENKLR